MAASYHVSRRGARHVGRHERRRPYARFVEYGTRYMRAGAARPRAGRSTRQDGPMRASRLRGRGAGPQRRASRPGSGALASVASTCAYAAERVPRLGLRASACKSTAAPSARARRGPRRARRGGSASRCPDVPWPSQRRRNGWSVTEGFARTPRRRRAAPGTARDTRSACIRAATAASSLTGRARRPHAPPAERRHRTR